jgi:hypothetical protein
VAWQLKLASLPADMNAMSLFTTSFQSDSSRITGICSSLSQAWHCVFVRGGASARNSRGQRDVELQLHEIAENCRSWFLKMCDLNSVVPVVLKLAKRFLIFYFFFYISFGDIVGIIKALESYFGISLDNGLGKRLDVRVFIATTVCIASVRAIEYLVDLEFPSKLLGFGNSPRTTSEPSPTPTDPWDFKNSRFAYKPLNPLQHEIRLLHLPQRTEYQSMLSSTAFTDTLNHLMYPTRHQFYHCTLKHVSLDDAPKYEALSYTWGVSEPTTQIIVDGQPFWITRNLAAALHHLTGHRDLILWVDAICINQKDNAEKSWQVRQMQQVYQQANRVLVWLGESGMVSMRALNKLADFEAFDDWNSSNHYDLTKLTIKALAAIRELDALFKLEKDPAQKSVPRIAHRSSLLEDDGQFPLNEIGAVLERAWWGRIWVVQELALAKDVSFVCGYDVIPGACIRSFLNMWDSLNRRFIPRMLDHRPWALFEIRDSVQTGSPLPIKDILQITSKAQLEATDPRDHIFGLLGLMKEGEQLKDLIDYDKSPESYVDVYIEVAKSLLDENDLWIFSFCNFLGSPTPSLPSWVPNWSRQSGRIPVLQTGGAVITGRRSPFRAWKGAHTSTTFIDQTPPQDSQSLG